MTNSALILWAPLKFLVGFKLSIENLPLDVRRYLGDQLLKCGGRANVCRAVACYSRAIELDPTGGVEGQVSNFDTTYSSFSYVLYVVAMSITMMPKDNSSGTSFNVSTFLQKMFNIFTVFEKNYCGIYLVQACLPRARKRGSVARAHSRCTQRLPHLSGAAHLGFLLRVST
jgi:hypothetical protein